MKVMNPLAVPAETIVTFLDVVLYFVEVSSRFVLL